MTLDEKLDWIARQLFILRPNMTEAAIREYHRIFTKPETSLSMSNLEGKNIKSVERHSKGLFLKDES